MAMALLTDYLGFFAGINHLMAYILIFFGAMIAADITAIAASIIAYNNYLGWLGIIAASMLGAYTSDNCIYALGKKLRNNKYGEWIENHLPYREKVERYLTNNHIGMVTLAKFIFGFNIPVLFMSGYLGLNEKMLKKSIKIAVAVWALVIFPLGYLIAVAIDGGLAQFGWKKMELSIAVAIVFAILLRSILHRIVGHKKLAADTINL